MTRGDEFYELMIESEPGDCVRWHGAHVGGGYGQVDWFGRHEYPHVLACEYAYGPRPDMGGRVEVRHSCRNRDCYNPHHLMWGSVSENQADRVRDGTHQHGERNSFAKLTQVEVDEIRGRWMGHGGWRGGGPTHEQLAAEYGVTAHTISRVIRRETWRLS